MQQTLSVQQEMIRRRLPVVIAVLVMVSFTFLMRMILWQAPQDPRVTSYVNSLRDANYQRQLSLVSDRGLIYDRNGELLASNRLQYRIGISPDLISDPEGTTSQLAAILTDTDPLEIARKVNLENSPYQLLATNVEPEVWRQISELEMISISAETIQRRYYPQNQLAAQIVGIAAGEGDTYSGYTGVEGYYQDQLAGRIREQSESLIPFELPQTTQPEQGADLILTIDRDVQYIVESTLVRAVENTQAQGGTIIVMRPRTGDILAMASYPLYDPNNTEAWQANQDLLKNRAITDIYEPGSVFKVLTVAAALDAGVITPDWTYLDTGLIVVGGKDIENWDKAAHGTVTTQQVLVDSLNVGAATISTEYLGWEKFYDWMARFYIGRRTGVDMLGEEAGILKIPGNPNWSEADLGANSYGQGVAVTPLQMLTAINAIANNGLMMKPRVVQQLVRDGEIQELAPVVLDRPITAETAKIVTNMMVEVVNTGLDDRAALAGYSIAGKTGTAEIPLPTGGYDPNLSKTTMVGFFPADDPQISLLIMLDRPRTGYWASEVAAPVFRELTSELVLIQKIPPDDVRYALAAQGGAVGEIDR